MKISANFLRRNPKGNRISGTTQTKSATSERPYPKPIQKIRKKIFAFGFDKLGFSHPTEDEYMIKDILVKFIQYKTNENLDDSGGLIFPSGLFESFREVRVPTRLNIEFSCDYDQLFARFRQIENLHERKKWVCCLVNQIIDNVPQGYTTADCSDTDLSKLILNKLGVPRELFDQGNNATTKVDEFKKYISRWGVAKTILFPRQIGTRILANVGRCSVGFENENLIFFLPFLVTQKNPDELISLIKEVVNSIETYIQKRSLEIPVWADQFEFSTEKKLKKDLDRIILGVSDLDQEISKWREFKGIIVRTGDLLRDTLISLLREFFGFNVGEEDVGREDFVLLDSNKSLIGIAESKGTKGGIKREYINQVDSHRERSGLSKNMAGILLINDFFEVRDLEKRKERPVDPDHIRHAALLKVLIIQTLTLLKLMHHIEHLPIDQRKKQFERLISLGGGLLEEVNNGNFVINQIEEKPKLILE